MTSDRVICTGCNGSGERSSNVASSDSARCDALGARVPCRSCEGRGWLPQRYPIRDE